jgi:hypothetical protein
MSRLKLKKPPKYNPFGKNKPRKMVMDIEANIPQPFEGEYLTSCAIIRDGETYGSRHRSHPEIRRALGDENPYNKFRGYQEGYITSEGRFVGRYEACDIGIRSGQVTGGPCEEYKAA